MHARIEMLHTVTIRQTPRNERITSARMQQHHSMSITSVAYIHFESQNTYLIHINVNRCQCTDRLVNNSSHGPLAVHQRVDRPSTHLLVFTLIDVQPEMIAIKKQSITTFKLTFALPFSEMCSLNWIKCPIHPSLYPTFPTSLPSSNWSHL